MHIQKTHLHIELARITPIDGPIATANVLKFRTLLSFFLSNKALVIRAGSHKILVRIANREDPDQTASSEAV